MKKEKCYLCERNKPIPGRRFCMDCALHYRIDEKDRQPLHEGEVTPDVMLRQAMQSLMG